jgi:hypothetical protein
MEFEDEKRYSSQHSKICTEIKPFVEVIGVQLAGLNADSFEDCLINWRLAALAQYPKL